MERMSLRNVPPGRYDMSATLERLPDMIQRVEVAGRIDGDRRLRFSARYAARAGDGYGDADARRQRSTRSPRSM
jgi:hypothetical protein